LEALNGRLKIRVMDTAATVWVSALDKNPITRSKRLLVTHLTDLQNQDISYAEPERKTLLNWGRMPHLVRAGRAELELPLSQAKSCKVWALSPGGRHIAEVPSRAGKGVLSFTADVGADSASGARMLYEVATE
jgi:hypothetical protein